MVKKRAKGDSGNKDKSFRKESNLISCHEVGSHIVLRGWDSPNLRFNRVKSHRCKLSISQRYKYIFKSLVKIVILKKYIFY